MHPIEEAHLECIFAAIRRSAPLTVDRASAIFRLQDFSRLVGVSEDELVAEVVRRYGAGR